MSGDEWEKAKAIITDALSRPRAERLRFLEATCSDPLLRVDIAELIRLYGDSTVDSLEVPARRNAAADPGLDDVGKFEGNSRFVVQRRLGEGAFGAVYQAWDRERQVNVALKVLKRHSPDVLFRFKREFRSLVTLRHPNLVRMYELFSEADHWFFSMELVRGEDFLSHVRPEGHCSEERLRAALAQLATGIHALHESGRLHRDLKPANALVTDSGRVAILDFGLVREVDRATGQLSWTQLAGTPAYMAPEQLLNGQVGTASDWYAVGVILFQALTGVLPQKASALRSLMADDGAPHELRALPPDVPADLDELCERLLQPRAQDRPTGAEILAVLSAPAVSSSGSVEREADHFVGRSDLLQRLSSLLADTQSGQLRVGLVSGRSGIGKTALVRSFLTEFENLHGDVLCLRGRCYESESVPYKGLDVLVDELGRYLERLPSSLVDPLLSRDASLLLKLFPVLGRVKMIAQAPGRALIAVDAQELRQRGFAALRELLARLGDRLPLVVWIDDLQWADRDSCSFLAELCAPPQQPRLLLLLTYRSEESEANATLSYLHQIFANQRRLGECHEITVGELTNEESHELLAGLTAGVSGISEEARAKIVDEAAGHPLFLQQLAQFAAAPETPASGAGAQPPAFQRLLARRIETLPQFAREVLEFICIAGPPLSPTVVFEAAESRGSAERADAMATLVDARLARNSGSEHHRTVEPYHHQVRNAVVGLLDSEARKARHARLAEILSRQQDIEPQVLVAHFEEAGDVDAAFEAALQAATVAQEKMAFDRAAVFYRVALKAKPPDTSQRGLLLGRLANALELAGRGRDAAHAYLDGAAFSAPSAQLGYELKAVDQLMRSGYLDEGLVLLQKLAAKVGISVPESPGKAVRSILVARARTRVRLLGGVPAPRSITADAGSLARLDLLRTGGVVLNPSDPVLATYFQTKHILYSLRLREPVHLSTALSVEATIRIAAGNGNVSAALRLLDEARDIAEATGNANALGFVLLARAHVDYLTQQVAQGIRHSREAIEFLRERCTAVAWELMAAHILLFGFLAWAGRVDEVRATLPRLLKDAAARGDVFSEVSHRLLGFVHYSYLAMDKPDESIDDTRRALAMWSSRGYQLQNHGAMYAIVECLLYRGEHAEARRMLLADWHKMPKSFILKWQTMLILALFLRGRVALACLIASPRDRDLRNEVATHARKLRRLASPWSSPMAAALDGGIAATDNRSEAAVRHFESAADGFEKSSLEAFAAASRYFAGRLHGREHGRLMMKSAVDFLTSQNVVDHDAFLNALVPGSSR